MHMHYIYILRIYIFFLIENRVFIVYGSLKNYCMNEYLVNN